MANAFWDSDFLPHGVTINAQYCSNLLQSDVHQVIWKKRPGKLLRKSTYCQKKKKNSHLHMANLMMATLQQWTGKS
jgi:hypothetical protein